MADLDLPLATHLAYGNGDIAITSSEQDVIAAVGAGHAIECDSIVVSNVHSADSDSVTVTRYIGATGTEIVKTMLVPIKTAVVVVSKANLQRLNEGDKITVTGAAASGKLKLLANWKDYSS